MVGASRGGPPGGAVDDVHVQRTQLVRAGNELGISPVDAGEAATLAPARAFGYDIDYVPVEQRVAAMNNEEVQA